MPRNLPKAVQKLQAQDPSVRRQAAEQLADGDERAIYPLIQALSDPNPGVQDAAMRSLIAIGGEVTAYMVLPLLREGTYLRNTALIILARLGAVTVPFLYVLLEDKDPDIRKFAIDLMCDIRESVQCERLLPMLRDENANVRAAAAKAVGELGYADAVSYLEETLKDEEWVCFYALQSLGELEARASAPFIVELLKSPSEVVRFSAIETLGKIGTPEVSETLISYLFSASGDERSAIVKSIVQIGITPAMVGLTEHLIRMLKDGDWEDKLIALRGIEVLNARSAVPLLVDFVGALDPAMPDTEERHSVISRTILSIDSESELLKLLAFPEMKYRGKAFAIELLGELGSKKAVPVIMDSLSATSRDLRRASAEALGDIGDASSIGPLLETSQKDVDAHVRKCAIEALGKIGTMDAFQPLLHLLSIEKYTDIIEKIVESLLRINAGQFVAGLSSCSKGVRTIAAGRIADVGILLNLAGDEDRNVKFAAIKGLGRIATAEALERLRSFIRDPDPEIRKIAVVAMGVAQCCSAELFAILNDENPWVRVYAVKAIAEACEPEIILQKLEAVLDDPFIPVVMSALDVIREIGGQEAYELLVQHRENKNGDVRAKIEEVLSYL
ncbi:MAG TPA: HEAT repeat domain-containing protein [Dissulfurispiraceae bacterium]|nr:HEAT repeat domain-containing protein [Dissulfurispiraceae bacterium]